MHAGSVHPDQGSNCLQRLSADDKRPIARKEFSLYMGWYMIAHAQMPLINTHSSVHSYARGLNFGPSLHLHPYFMYVGSEGSGDSACIALAFAAGRCDKYQILYNGLYIIYE